MLWFVISNRHFYVYLLDPNTPAGFITTKTIFPFHLVEVPQELSSPINDLPRLKLIVVNTISISEDKEVVLLITLAGFVLDIPVVLPGNLVIISETQNITYILQTC